MLAEQRAMSQRSVQSIRPDKISKFYNFFPIQSSHKFLDVRSELKVLQHGKKQATFSA